MAGPAARDQGSVLSAPARRIVAGLTLFAAINVVAATGYVLVAGASPADAVYMVIITIFGVGYGEVVAVDTPPLRMLTMALIVVGYGSVIYTGGGVIQLLLDGELNRVLGARRMTRDIDSLTGHVIICGYGRVGANLARHLAADGQPFVAIDADGGGPNADPTHLIITGDATEEEVLAAAGIDRARTLAAVLSEDAANVYITLTARSMNDHLTIISRGEDRRVEGKLRSCGADHVVLPTEIGATRMAEIITRPSAEELLERLEGSSETGEDLALLGLHVHPIPIPADSPMVGRTLGEVEFQGAHGYLVVAIHGADGSTVVSPPADTMLRVGDTVVVLGRRDQIPRVTAKFTTSARISYRGVTSG